MANGRTVLPGPELMLSLTPGTSITFIDDQPVILSRDRRALFEVNQIGGYLVCRLLLEKKKGPGSSQVHFIRVLPGFFC